MIIEFFPARSWKESLRRLSKGLSQVGRPGSRSQGNGTKPLHQEVDVHYLSGYGCPDVAHDPAGFIADVDLAPEFQRQAAFDQPRSEPLFR